MADTQNQMEPADLKRAIGRLKDGGVVAIPTDTLYGLAADVFNPTALDRVFAVKRRSDDLALPVLVNGWEQVLIVAKDLPPQAEGLAGRFWPGALTLVVLRADGVPGRLTAGGPTVAVRMPAHPVPIELMDGLGGPITGTSANVSGGPDPSTLDDLTAQIGGSVDYMTAKAGLIALSKHLALQLAPTNVRVNCIAPGSIDFPGGTWDRFQKTNTPEVVAEFITRNLPAGQFGWPEPIG